MSSTHSLEKSLGNRARYALRNSRLSVRDDELTKDSCDCTADEAYFNDFTPLHLPIFFILYIISLLCRLSNTHRRRFFRKNISYANSTLYRCFDWQTFFITQFDPQQHRSNTSNPLRNFFFSRFFSSCIGLARWGNELRWAEGLPFDLC